MTSAPAPSGPVNKSFDPRVVWMAGGLVAGLALSHLWPAAPALAVATDSSDRMAICTVEVGQGNPEAVFVLDSLTGRLQGAMLNAQNAVFTNYFARQIAGDFRVDASAKPQYVMIPGRAELNSGQGVQVATGVIYVAELTTGRVIAYRFPFRTTREVLAPAPLDPFAFFPFREATTDN